MGTWTAAQLCRSFVLNAEKKASEQVIRVRFFVVGRVGRYVDESGKLVLQTDGCLDYYAIVPDFCPE